MYWRARRDFAYRLLDAQDFAGAVTNYTGLLAARERDPAYGAIHPFTVRTRYYAALAADGAGSRDVAIPLMRRVLAEEIADPGLGPTHPDTLASRMHLGRMLIVSGDRIGAVEQFTAAQAGYDQLGEPYASERGIAADGLSRLQRAGHTTTSTPFAPSFPKGVTRSTATWSSSSSDATAAAARVFWPGAAQDSEPEEDPSAGGDIDRLDVAHALERQGRWADAAEIYLEILRIIASDPDPELGENESDALLAHLGLARTAFALGDYDAAREHAERARDGFADKDETYLPQLEEATALLDRIDAA